MVRDGGVLTLPHRAGDVHVKRGGDQHRRGEAQQEQQREIVHDEILGAFHKQHYLYATIS